MKLQSNLVLFSLLTMTFFSSCEVVGDIFEAGVWSGIMLVGGGIVLVIFLLAKFFKK